MVGTDNPKSQIIMAVLTKYDIVAYLFTNKIFLQLCFCSLCTIHDIMIDSTCFYNKVSCFCGSFDFLFVFDSCARQAKKITCDNKLFAKFLVVNVHHKQKTRSFYTNILHVGF